MKNMIQKAADEIEEVLSIISVIEHTVSERNRCSDILLSSWHLVGAVLNQQKKGIYRERQAIGTRYCQNGNP